MTWNDVDWEKGSILVHSPKTEHHTGKETRLVPMFPRLREELELQWDISGNSDCPYVIDQYRDTAANMRTHLRRIIFRAGLPEWERTFQNLRSSASTDIEAEYGGVAESEWVGHSERTARRHYLQVTDAQFMRAVGGNGEAVGAVETDGKRETYPVES